MSTEKNTGIWLIGARGGVASTVLLGLTGLKQGLLIDSAGLVSELPEFAHLPLIDLDRLVAGGHEIRSVGLLEEVRKLSETSGAVPATLVDRCADALDTIDRRIRPGVLSGCGEVVDRLADPELPRDVTARAAVERIERDLADFATANDLSHVVVVNLASTEPMVDIADLPTTWEAFDRLLDAPLDTDTPASCPLPASTLYAIGAMRAGFDYVNFTPSLGSAPPAIDELARQRGVCQMGCDGKTGETLLKSVLGPMFRKRHLPVMSWVGHNIFGNLDGKVLDDPANKASKIASKDRLLAEILGYRPQTLVSIEYIESLGDWKTAWDHIHFRGFLGTQMTLQFTWQGCDSLLAAPLVLDLIRFTELARRRGHTGQLPFLASFFKSPYGVSEHDFGRQYEELLRWASS